MWIISQKVSSLAGKFRVVYLTTLMVALMSLL